MSSSFFATFVMTLLSVITQASSLRVEHAVGGVHLSRRNFAKSLAVPAHALSGAQFQRRRWVVTTFAAATCLALSAPANAAEQPPQQASQQTSSQEVRGTQQTSSQEVRGTVNGVSAVVASNAEAAKLAKEAELLQLPNVPPNSDLAKLLAGSSSTGPVSDPRAHSN